MIGLIWIGLACALPTAVTSTATPQPMNSAVTPLPDNRSTSLEITADFAAVDLWESPPPPPDENESEAVQTQTAGIPILGPGFQTELLLNNQTASVSINAAGRASLYVVISPLGSFDPAVQVADQANNFLFEQDDRGAGEPELLSITTADRPRLNLTIQGDPNDGAGVRVAVFADANEVFRDLLAVNDSVDQGDVNRHRVNLTAGEVVLIRLVPDNETDLIVELYDSNDIVFSSDEGFTAEAEEFFYTPQETAEHVIAVYGFQFQGGSYGLSVRELAIDK